MNIIINYSYLIYSGIDNILVLEFRILLETILSLLQEVFAEYWKLSMGYSLCA